jgi:hypothetical protein
MRARARECEKAAAAGLDPGVVKMYADLARQWHEMADQWEKMKLGDA